MPSVQQNRAVGAGVGVRELADRRRRDAGHALAPLQRVRLDRRPVLLEPRVSRARRSLVHQAGVDDLAADRVGQRDVGADVEPEPGVGPLRGRGVARVHGVHAGAAAEALQHVVEEDRVGLPRVGAPQDHQVGLFRLHVGGGAAARTEHRRQTDDTGSVSSAVAQSMLFVPITDPDELLRGEVHLVRGLGAAEHPEARRPRARARPAAARPAPRPSSPAAARRSRGPAARSAVRGTFAIPITSSPLFGETRRSLGNRGCGVPPRGSLRVVPGNPWHWGLGSASGLPRRPRTSARASSGLKATESVCPYCAVGCGQVVYTRGGELGRRRGPPALPHQPGHALSQGLRHAPARPAAAPGAQA